MQGPLPFRPPFRRQTLSPVDQTPRVIRVDGSAGTMAGGTSVTIYGANFRVLDDGTQPTVTFGGVAATSVTVTSSTTINCVTPAATVAGLSDVAVTIQGLTGSLGGGFLYYDIVVSAVTPSYGTLAGGTSVIITGFNFPPDAIPYFGDTPAASWAWMDSQHIKAVTPNHAIGFVDVSIRSAANMFSPSIFSHSIFHTGAVPQTTYGSLRLGFQYTLLTRGNDIRRIPSIRVTEQLNGAQPNTCTFTIDGESNRPLIGEQIQIVDEEDGNRLLFAGTIQSFKQRYEGQTSQLAWDVTAVDFSFLMNRKRPFGVYRNVSVTDIVKDLISKYAPGFTTNNVQTNLAKITITFDGSKDLWQCLMDLASAIGGGHVYVDYAQDVHFFHILPSADVLAAVGLGSSTPQAPTAPVEDHLVAVAGAPAPSTSNAIPSGYYVFQPQALYSDGSVSPLGNCSDPIFLDGTKTVSFTNVPTYENPGAGVTVLARRIWYRVFGNLVRQEIVNSSTINDGTTVTDYARHPFFWLQCNDNTNTSIPDTYFRSDGIYSVDSPSAPPISGAIAPPKTYPTPLVSTPSGMQLLSNEAANLFVSGQFSGEPYQLVAQVNPPSGSPTLVGSPTGSLPVIFKISRAAIEGWPVTVLGETTIGVTWTDNVTPISWSDSNGHRGTIYTSSSWNLPTTSGPSPGAGTDVFRVYASIDGGSTWYLVGSPACGDNIRAFFRAQFIIAPGAPQSAPQVGLPGSNTLFTIRAWYGYNGLTPLSTPSVTSGGNVAYFASPTSAAEMETDYNNLFTLRRPQDTSIASVTPADVITATPVIVAGYTSGSSYLTRTDWAQFKVVYLYRDGRISYAGPPSATAGLQVPQYGYYLIGWSFTGLPIGNPVDGHGVIARLIYHDSGKPKTPNAQDTFTSTPAVGTLLPNGTLADPTWEDGGSGWLFVPDNTTTRTDNQSAGVGQDPTGSQPTQLTTYYQPWVGQAPVNKSQQQLAFSSDPIPIWPNPDGPNPEDSLPQPTPINDENAYLLHEDAGGTPFQVDTDMSQIRNRILVFGSGSVSTSDAAQGVTQISINDVTAFSPHGGTLRIVDQNSGVVLTVPYLGVGGFVGAAYVQLANPLPQYVPQGSTLTNFLQADDRDSQRYLATIELDVNGSPTDGIHEYVIYDPSLKAKFQLYMRAYAELELYAWPIQKIRYTTLDPNTHPGRTVNVDITDPPCKGDFLIQQVEIDKVRDEGEQVQPRYTAEASTVRYSINDLLLRILGGNGGGSGVSSAGVVATATTSSDASDLISTFKGGFTYSFLLAANSATITTVGQPAPSLGGTASAFVDTRGMWMRSVSTASAGQNAGYAQSGTFVRAEHEPVILFYCRMGPDLTNARIWFGWWSVIGPGNNDVPTEASFGLRMSTVAGDTGPSLFTQTGSTGATFLLGGIFPQFNPSMEYNIRIASVSAGKNLSVTISSTTDGAYTATGPVTRTMALPPSFIGLNIFPSCRIITTTNTAKQIDFLRIGLQHGLRI